MKKKFDTVDLFNNINELVSVLTHLKNFFLHHPLPMLNEMTPATLAEIGATIDSIHLLVDQLHLCIEKFSRTDKRIDFNDRNPVQVIISYDEGKHVLTELQDLIENAEEKRLIGNLAEEIGPLYQLLSYLIHDINIMQHSSSDENRNLHYKHILEKIISMKALMLTHLFDLNPSYAISEEQFHEDHTRSEMLEVEGENTIFTLPDELLFTILHCLTDIQDISFASLACKKFNEILSEVGRNQLRIYFPDAVTKLEKKSPARLYHELTHLEKCKNPNLNKSTKKLLRLIKEGNLEAIKTHSFDPLDLLSLDRNDLNLLDWAKKKNHEEILDYFFQRVIEECFSGQPLDLQRDPSGKTVLMWAVLSYRPASEIKKLIIQGANIHAQDDNEDNALSFAAGTGQAGTIKTLLAAGAHSYTAPFEDLIPVIIAARGGHLEAVKLLLELDEDNEIDWETTPLLHCLLCGYLTGVKTFVRAGVETEGITEKGENMLMVAIDCIDSGSINFRNYSLSLEYITRLKIVQFALKECADINAVDNGGNNALSLAVKKNLVDVIKLVLAAGAKVNSVIASQLKALNIKVPEEALLPADTIQCNDIQIAKSGLSEALNNFLSIPQIQSYFYQHIPPAVNRADRIEPMQEEDCEDKKAGPRQG